MRFYERKDGRTNTLRYTSVVSAVCLAFLLLAFGLSDNSSAGDGAKQRLSGQSRTGNDEGVLFTRIQPR